ncbi:MAG: phosphoglucosamine mutase [Clostridia bacterium]|nr:phosphoglucosamine mutase [Clostridia bacterium]
MTKFFGTDGVRGVAGSYLDAQLALNLGRYSTYVISRKNTKKIRIVIGKDTRISSDMLEAAFVSGALSCGAEVVTLGVIPTPAVAYMTRKLGADAGVVISASHNPVEYNGIKFFNSDGEKLSDELEEEIEEYLLGNKTIPAPLTGGDIGRLKSYAEGSEDYLNHAVSAAGCDLTGMKIAVDCSNGANSFIAPEAFKKLGAEVFVKSASPDGININENCGSVHIKSLSEFVTGCKADVGIAFDGDADRVLAVDENGDALSGDVLIGLIAIEYKKRGILNGNTVVGTVMSNMGLSLTLKEQKIDFVATKVGDRYVYEKMAEIGGVIGGEESGHIISTLYNTTGDGLVCALEFLKLLKKSGKNTSELRKSITILPQIVLNAKTNGVSSADILKDEELSRLISDTQEKYSSSGRVLIRPSGTEPVIRVMIEGKDKNEMIKDAEKIRDFMESLSRKGE